MWYYKDFVEIKTRQNDVMYKPIYVFLSNVRYLASVR